MKRQFTCILCIALMVFTVNLFAAGTTEKSTEKVTIRYPHWFFGHGGNFEQWINGAVDGFEKKYPNVHVEREQVPYDTYWDKLDTGLASGNPPDVAAFWFNLRKYIEAGALMPLNDLIDMNDVNKNFSPFQTKSIPEAAPDGKTYGLAFDTGFYLPMYRPSVFRSAGIAKYATDLDEFFTQSQKLMTKDRYGYAFVTQAGNWGEQIINLSTWTIALGGHWGDTKGRPTLDSKEVIQAVTYLKKLFDMGAVPKDVAHGDFRKMFATGHVGTLIDGVWVYGLANGWDPETKTDFATAPLPFPTQRVAGFYECNSIFKACKHPKEAAALIQFISNDEQQQKIAEMPHFPARTSIFTPALKKTLIERWPWYAEYINHAGNGVPMSPLSMGGEQMVETQKIWGKYFDKVLFENMDPKEAMTVAQKEAMALVK